MKNVTKSICWALAILLVAIGNRFGLIEDKVADTLFVVLPIVAVMSLGNGCGCFSRRGRAERA